MHLEFYQKVNKTKNLKELADVIREIGGVNKRISGRVRPFDSDLMAEWCEKFSFSACNMLTREYGIRQQAMLHYFYNDIK